MPFSFERVDQNKIEIAKKQNSLHQQDKNKLNLDKRRASINF